MYSYFRKWNLAKVRSPCKLSKLYDKKRKCQSMKYKKVNPDRSSNCIFPMTLVSMSIWPNMPVQIWNLSVRSRQVSWIQFSRVIQDFLTSKFLYYVGFMNCDKKFKNHQKERNIVCFISLFNRMPTCKLKITSFFFKFDLIFH